MCLYDLEQFGGAVIFNLLKTHPILLLGGLLLENPHYKITRRGHGGDTSKRAERRD